jgi:hypothetical protein
MMISDYEFRRAYERHQQYLQEARQENMLREVTRGRPQPWHRFIGIFGELTATALEVFYDGLQPDQEVGVENRHGLSCRFHASTVASLWGQAGIEVTMRTSFAAGHPQVSWRDGYRVIRKAGRYMVFPRAAFSELMRWHGERDGLVEIWNGMPFFSPASRPRSVFRLPNSIGI